MFVTAFRALVLFTLASTLVACQRRPGAEIADSPTEELPTKMAVGQEQDSVSRITNQEQKLLRPLTLGELQKLSYKLQVAVELNPERSKKKYEDLPAWSRRKLTDEEKLVITAALALAKDEGQDPFVRSGAVNVLRSHAHLSILNEIVVLTKLIPPKDQAYQKGIPQFAVLALACIADKRVIPHLIEALGHPHEDVRLDAFFKLRGLIGLPQRYSSGGPVNFDMIGQLEDPAERERIVKDLTAWWEENQQKIEPYWDAGWEDF